MTTYNETKPLAEWIALKARIEIMQDDFTDVDGVPVTLGTPVQYIATREDESEWYDSIGSVWNPERWGIVVALIKTPKFDYETHTESETEFDVSVKMEKPNVISSRRNGWSRDEFTCDVKSVRVIK